eukprot:Lankesteria_metandrocarpae@DN5401_c1_g2_i2.p1
MLPYNMRSLATLVSVTRISATAKRPLYGKTTTTTAVSSTAIATVPAIIRGMLYRRMALCASSSDPKSSNNTEQIEADTTTNIGNMFFSEWRKWRSMFESCRRAQGPFKFQDVPGVNCITESCIASARAAALGVLISPLTYFGRQFRINQQLSKKNDISSESTASSGHIPRLLSDTESTRSACSGSDSKSADGWLRIMKHSAMAGAKLGFMNSATDCVLSNLQDTYSWITPTHTTCLGGALSEWNGGAKAMLSGCVSAVVVSSAVEKLVKMSVKDKTDCTQKTD